MARNYDFISRADLNQEEISWLRLSPAQRMMESARLWRFYIAMGGSLDPEPDPQSPFYHDESKAS